jgi:ribonuclease HI
MGMAANPEVTIYTDGACVVNPGPGGYGIVLLYKTGRHELSGGFVLTTNNRMELMGPIVALESLADPTKVVVISDSMYVVQGIQAGWAKAWRKKGWKRKTADVPNADLWKRLLMLCEKHNARFKWVRGHNGDAENERCDVLAEAAARSPDLAPDHGYIPRRPAQQPLSRPLGSRAL